MLWLALCYGLALGAAQFFLLKALVRLALARRSGAAARLPLLLAAKLAVYLAAALGAVYLFEETLLWAGVGLGAGLVGLAVLQTIASLRRANAHSAIPGTDAPTEEKQ